MYVHGNPWPRRILTQMCPQKSPWDSPLLAGRISHPGMLIVLYSQNRIEIDPAAKNEAEIYPMHGAEIYPAKSLGQQIDPTSSINRSHETAWSIRAKALVKMGRNFRHTDASRNGVLHTGRG